MADIRAEGGKVVMTMEPDEARDMAHLINEHVCCYGLVPEQTYHDLRRAADQTGEQIAGRMQG
jgi:hypothetical protein